MTRKIGNFEPDIRLVDILGRSLDVRLEDVPDYLLHRKTLLFYALSIVVLLAADPSNISVHYAFPVTAGYWVAGFVVYLALYTPALLVVAPLQTRFPRLLVPLPLLSILVLIPALSLTTALADSFSGTDLRIFAPKRFLPLFLTVQVLETVFSRYVLPEVIRKTRSVKTRALEAQPRHIAVGHHRLPIDRLYHVCAQEHFIHIQLQDTHIRHRARLSDLIAQTAPEDGIQPHRSWWVSRNAKPRLDREGSRHVLVLEDKTVVPVARTRLREIEDWLDRRR
ncbi:LytTR family DNA-binding domain-containing protein [Primorskyibacter flagellatus]|uniref:LytTr DNA-binding domain-containing protein n=1 Tax=Primorskyibacter flagellatus TaxID=1387277 RepID=A0A1W2E6E1_9RHOB|nr:LytTR family DNA-binding domain-containing protein [Primorskyibacter flagellatus]SMD05215.1 LytTr DNA-binding domain-containing protein [Primorskyibacter flagellatus]